MCGRYANTKSGEELGAYFEADEVDAVAMPASWNIAPTQQVPIVVDRVPKDDPDGMPSRLVTAARWSLVPRWATELASKYPTFNARSETVTEKATFKNAVVRSRAILPADGYYEWHTVDGPSGKPVKTPHWITDPVEGELAFAGLYSRWRPPVAEGAEPEPWVLTATMLTRAAHGPAASIHDRAPVRTQQDELLVFQDNPGHKRAKLISLSERGKTVYLKLDEKQSGWATICSKDMSKEELETTLSVLKRIAVSMDR